MEERSRFSVLGSRFSAPATLTSAALLVCAPACDSSDPPRTFADDSGEAAVAARVLKECVFAEPPLEVPSLDVAEGPVCEQGGDGFYHHPLQGLEQRTVRKHRDYAALANWMASRLMVAA
jgi:hypothetical protein